jgi:hypothetical protein
MFVITQDCVRDYTGLPAGQRFVCQRTDECVLSAISMVPEPP